MIVANNYPSRFSRFLLAASGAKISDELCFCFYIADYDVLLCLHGATTELILASTLWPAFFAASLALVISAVSVRSCSSSSLMALKAVAMFSISHLLTAAVWLQKLRT